MALIEPFSGEQARALVNLDLRYQVWMEAEQTLVALPAPRYSASAGASTTGAADFAGSR